MRIGLGCMRLSTARERDDERAVAVMHAALDAGATVLDTADAYALDAEDRGHNERLVARALASWPGDRSKVTVATKGGMTRPDGKWVADGRARSLASACEASLEALGRIDLYQLHAPDPRTPFETSVRALARLKEAKLIDAIGLCNVNVAQIDKARSIVPIAAVQVALSWRDDGALRSGVVRHCAALGIELLAHSPLGGWRRRGRVHPVLESIAQDCETAPEVVALAWLLTLGVTPLVGATRVETAKQLALARSLELDERARTQLDEAFPAASLARTRMMTSSGDAEVVLISGIAGAGKSRLAERYVERGYKRLNRDEQGGKLTQLLPALEQGLSS
ncbi:MAG TPA: aldo/keto reductase, partial [Polyangiaceae bacterium]|nr:aldo/keto reductase [Polyangiaceae bacterium]